MGIASLILGIFGLIFCWTPFGWILSIPGIILGAIGKKNGGPALAGMIISIIALVLFGLIYGLACLCAASNPTYYY